MRSASKFTFGILQCLASVFMLTNCSVVLGIESDRHTLTDDHDGGTNVLPSNWACINEPVPALGSEAIQISFRFTDAIGNQSSSTFAGTPIANVEVKACGVLDFSCELPIDTKTADADGRASLTVPVGFNGYYEARPPGDYPPYIIKRTNERHSEAIEHPLLKTGLFTVLATLAQVTPDQNLCTAFVSVVDCNFNPAPGIRFAISNMTPEARIAYGRERLIDPSATVTDLTGAAIAFNVPPGTLSVVASFPETNRVIGQFSGLMRPGWVTFLHTRLDQAKPAARD
jgi:hypothetical protein